MKKEILYIDREKFLRQMFEVMGKQNSVGVYSIDDFRENEYLIADLMPELIFFDVSTIEAYGLERFFTLNFFQSKLVAVGKAEEMEKISNYQQFLFSQMEKPIEVKSLLLFVKETLKNK